MKKLSLILALLLLPSPILAIEASLWELDKKYGSYDLPSYWEKKGYSLNHPTVQLNIIDSINRQPLKSPPNGINVRIRWPARIGGESNYWWDCSKGRDAGGLYFRHPPHGQVNFKSPWYIIPTIRKRPMCINVYEIEPAIWEITQLVSLHKGHNRIAIKIEKPLPISKPLRSEPSETPREPSYPSKPSGELAGWWVFKFGMTKEQARETMEANKDKVLKYDIYKDKKGIMGGIGISIQIYDREWHGNIVFTGDRLNLIQLFLTRKHENVRTYGDFERIHDYYYKRLVDKYGPSDLKDVRKCEGEDCVEYDIENRWEFENARIKMWDNWGAKGSRICSNLEEYSLGIHYEMKSKGGPRF